MLLFLFTLQINVRPVLRVIFVFIVVLKSASFYERDMSYCCTTHIDNKPIIDLSNLMAGFYERAFRRELLSYDAYRQQTDNRFVESNIPSGGLKATRHKCT